MVNTIVAGLVISDYEYKVKNGSDDTLDTLDSAIRAVEARKKIVVMGDTTEYVIDQLLLMGYEVADEE